MSRFAAGPVSEETRRTTRSPAVQPWWRAMASNWIIQGRNWAVFVPSNVGTLGLDDGHENDELLPGWQELCCMSPLFLLSSSCVGCSLRRNCRSRLRAFLSSLCSRVRVSLKASSWSRVRVSPKASSWSRVRVSRNMICSPVCALLVCGNVLRVSRTSSWSPVRAHPDVRQRVARGSHMCLHAVCLILGARTPGVRQRAVFWR